MFHDALQIPTFGFLYVAGYIGYVGRQYVLAVKSAAKPTEKEIIIDVPLALKLAFQGWAWPLATVAVRTEGASYRQQYSSVCLNCTWRGYSISEGWVMGCCCRSHVDSHVDA
jgi:hypothetical protein